MSFYSVVVRIFFRFLVMLFPVLSASIGFKCPISQGSVSNCDLLTEFFMFDK